MVAGKRYTLGKSERLKSRKSIGQLFSSGQSFSNFPFRVLYILSQPEKGDPAASPLRAAFSVSTRNFKKAVDRNRVKRLSREAWRLQKHLLQDLLVQQGQQMTVFLIFTAKELPEYAVVAEKIKTVITRLHDKAMLP
jgi:ribonuclease P protein component